MTEHDVVTAAVLAADARAVRAERKMAEAILQMARLERKVAAAERGQAEAERRAVVAEQDATARIKAAETRLTDALSEGKVNRAEYRRGYYAGHAAGKRGAEARIPDTRRRLKAVV